MRKFALVVLGTFLFTSTAGAARIIHFPRTITFKTKPAKTWTTKTGKGTYYCGGWNASDGSYIIVCEPVSPTA